MTKNLSEKWIKGAISDGYIKYFEYNEFDNLNEIGEGGFGKVFKCNWKDGEFIALKCLKFNKRIDEKIFKSFIKELRLLRMVSSHPNVITFHGVTKDGDGYYNLILQYANEGTLRDYLEEKFTELQWVDKLRIATEIAIGLLFIHNKDIIHRDLHSNNILIHDGQPKISDFGLSKETNDIMTSNSVLHGVVAYVEPKCFIDSTYKRDKKSDVYSFGQLLWEISSGKQPFSSFNLFVTTLKISKGEREEPNKGTPTQYSELYKKCWDNEPDKRPETEKILDTLKKINPNEILSDTLIENSEISSNKIGANSLEITSSSLCLPDEMNSNTLVQDNNILENLRKEAQEAFKQGEYLKAFEFFEKILEDVQHSPKDQKCASTWNLSNNFDFENIKELKKALCKNTQLTSLDLSSNELGSEVGKSLADVLRNNSTLTFLNLNSNELGPKGGKALADALCMNSTLTSLNLGSNELGSKGVKALADALCKNSTLTSLYLGSNELESEEGKLLADALCENSTLTSLDLSKNNLGSEGGKALADALCKNSTLTSLNFDSNKLGSEGGRALAGALCKNSTLKDLKLYDNDLGPEEGKALADALCKNSTLEDLNIKYNNLGSEGGIALANALCKNSTLKHLNIGANHLGSEGGKAIADVLCKNSTLKNLNLYANDLGPKEGRALADALIKNSTLTSLDLFKNNLGHDGGKALADALCENSALTSLIIDFNAIGDEIKNKIENKIKQNNQFINLKQ